MNTSRKSAPRVVLDWSKLLGFDQVSSAPRGYPVRLTDDRLNRLGAKVGVKPVVKS